MLGPQKKTTIWIRNKKRHLKARDLLDNINQSQQKIETNSSSVEYMPDEILYTGEGMLFTQKNLIIWVHFPSFGFGLSRLPKCTLDETLCSLFVQVSMLIFGWLLAENTLASF